MFLFFTKLLLYQLKRSFKFLKYEVKEAPKDQNQTYDAEIAWVTYAKDFCGELISGKYLQT